MFLSTLETSAKQNLDNLLSHLRQLEAVDERIDDGRNQHKLDCDQVLDCFWQRFGPKPHVQQIKEQIRHHGDEAESVRQTSLHELSPAFFSREALPDQIHVGPDDDHEMAKVEDVINTCDDGVAPRRRTR